MKAAPQPLRQAQSSKAAPAPGTSGSAFSQMMLAARTKPPVAPLRRVRQFRANSAFIRPT